MELGGYEQKFENGYLLFSKIIGLFFESGQAITAVTSMVIIFLLYWLIYKYSMNYMLSISLYVSLGIYQTEMNMARNAIAIFICYLAMKYIEEEKLIKYILMISIASTFHTTAIIFSPLYFLSKIKLTLKQFLILFLALFPLIGFFPVLSPYLDLFIPARYSAYILGNTTKYEALMLGILNIALVLLVVCFSNRSKWKSAFQEHYVGFWMLLLNIFSFGIAYFLPIGTRIAALFGPYMIIFLPNLIKSTISVKKYETIAIMLVVIICWIQYFIRLSINNIGTTMPYLFYWE